MANQYGQGYSPESGPSSNRCGLCHAQLQWFPNDAHPDCPNPECRNHDGKAYTAIRIQFGKVAIYRGNGTDPVYFDERSLRQALDSHKATS
jgi:hypothetical protein